MKSVNAKLAFIWCGMAVMCAWIMWISTYMHQLNPLITPTASQEDSCFSLDMQFTSKTFGQLNYKSLQLGQEMFTPKDNSPNKMIGLIHY